MSFISRLMSPNRQVGDNSLLGQNLGLDNEQTSLFDSLLNTSLGISDFGKQTIEGSAQSNLNNAFVAEEGMKEVFKIFGTQNAQNTKSSLDLLKQRQFYDTSTKEQESQYYTRMILEKMYNMEEELNRNEMSNRFQLAKSAVGMARYS